MGPLEGSRTSDLSLDAAASAAEHRAHAGMLADAGAQLLRIEAMETIAESEAATREALATGLETWSGVAVDGSGLALPSGESLQAWAAVIGPLGPAVLLVAAPTLGATCRALAVLRDRTTIALGGSLPVAGADTGRDAEARGGGDEPPGAEAPTTSAPVVDPRAGRLLDAGSVVLGAGADGSPESVALLRGRRDDLERRRVWLAQVVDRALPGPALWLARRAPGFPLPGPFAWDVVEPHELGRLPAGRYRIAVAPADDAGAVGAATEPLMVEQLRQLVTALEPGAWILVEGAPSANVLASDERTGGLLPAERLPSRPPCWMVRLRP